ncbi:MAG: helix-turn-helix domain-containing protein [Candidatus Helarchaeota archaeon]|nr:helix-turn-helix domain-containing protein [Candidatus Helarchaeota archaeon]
MVRLKRKLVSKIKKLRAERGITQEQLAQAVDVTRQTISYLEKGEYNPSLKIAHDIAKFFEKSIDEIFNYEPILKIKREEFNLSQEQLAMLIGISTDDLQKLENEEYDNPPEFITKIAKQLNCEVEDLVE